MPLHCILSSTICNFHHNSNDFYVVKCSIRRRSKKKLHVAHKIYHHVRLPFVSVGACVHNFIFHKMHWKRKWQCGEIAFFFFILGSFNRRRKIVWIVWGLFDSIFCFLMQLLFSFFDYRLKWNFRPFSCTKLNFRKVVALT